LISINSYIQSTLVKITLVGTDLVMRLIFLCLYVGMLCHKKLAEDNWLRILISERWSQSFSSMTLSKSLWWLVS